MQKKQKQGMLQAYVLRITKRLAKNVIKIRLKTDAKVCKKGDIKITNFLSKMLQIRFRKDATLESC